MSAQASAQRERPILFSAPMILAIRAGQKSQTRRIVKGDALAALSGAAGRGFTPEMVADPSNRFSPYGYPGDQLWVRETGWERPERSATMLREGADTWVPYYYDTDLNAGDHADFKDWGFKRRPSIFMPRWASRTSLDVTALRIERLQAISEEDAIAEGLRPQVGDGGAPGAGFKWTGTGYQGAIPGYFHTPGSSRRCNCKVGGPSPAQCAFRELWNAINGKRAPWESDPWCWVISFERVKP